MLCDVENTVCFTVRALVIPRQTKDGHRNGMDVIMVARLRIDRPTDFFFFFFFFHRLNSHDFLESNAPWYLASS